MQVHMYLDLFLPRSLHSRPCPSLWAKINPLCLGNYYHNPIVGCFQYAKQTRYSRPNLWWTFERIPGKRSNYTSKCDTIMQLHNGNNEWNSTFFASSVQFSWSHRKCWHWKFPRIQNSERHQNVSSIFADEQGSKNMEVPGGVQPRKLLGREWKFPEKSILDDIFYWAEILSRGEHCEDGIIFGVC